MQTYFYELADFVGTLLHPGEIYLAYLSAEDSHFVRFNKSSVRQAGSVKQIVLTLSLISQQRRAESRLTLTGLHDNDQSLLRAALETLRRDLGDLPVDPYLLFNEHAQSTERIGESALPDDAGPAEAVSAANQGNGRAKSSCRDDLHRKCG